jgi:hypothetical protein
MFKFVSRLKKMNESLMISKTCEFGSNGLAYNLEIYVCLHLSQSIYHTGTFNYRKVELQELLWICFVYQFKSQHLQRLLSFMLQGYFLLGDVAKDKFTYL